MKKRGINFYKSSSIKLSVFFITVLISFFIFEWNSSGAVLVTRTWDGGGATNNWSESANWSGDTVPGSGDDVVFDGTSTKNAVINVNVSIRNLNINSGYTGTITQADGTNFTMTAGTTSSQADGVFVCGNGIISFNNVIYTMTGGAFNCQNGTINSSFFRLIINGGTFNAPSGTMTFGSGTNLQLAVGAGGTFNHSNGTVVLNSSDIRFSFVAGASGVQDFHNLTVNVSNVVLRDDLDSLRVLGTLNLIDGDLQPAIEAHGDILIADTFGNGSGQTGTGTLHITGAAARTVTLPTLVSGEDYLQIDLDAPNVTMNASGAGPVKFRPLNLINGTFNAGTTPVTFIANVFPSQTGGIFNCGTAVIRFSDTTFTQSGGQFNCQNGAIEGTGVNANLTFSGGTFNAPSGTMTFNGATVIIRNEPAIFNHSNGTIIFTGTSARVEASSSIFEFNNLTVNVSNSFALNVGNVTARVFGNLNLTGGNVFGGNLEPRGNVAVGNGFGGTTSNTSSLTFAGSNNQTYINNGGENPRGTWSIDKTGGTVTAANSIILPIAAQVFNITNGTLFLNDGSNLTAGVLNIGAGGRLVNESSTVITLGGNPVNNGVLDLQGGGAACPENDTILLRSTVAGTRRNWSGTGVFRLVDVDARDMGGTSATAPAITVFSGTNSGNNNTNWTFNANCPPDVSITPSNVNVAVTGSQTFTAGGGFPPYTFSLVTNNSGATLNTATGQYTAGTTPNVIDTVRATDFFGSTAEATINVTTGAPAQLAFITQPTSQTAGDGFDPPIQVAVQDQFGNTVTNATNAVTLSLQNNPCGGFVSIPGGNTRNAVGGIATFDFARVTTACEGYTLQASGGGLTSAVSNSFNITPGSPAGVRFVNHPINTTALEIITPAVTVAVVDIFDNRIPNATDAITIAIQDNPGNSVLSGTLTRSAVNGLATFNDLSLNGPGIGYTLIATADGLNSHFSLSFDITRPDIFVTNTDDSGDGSLRQAIITANNITGLDEIRLQIPGGGTPKIAPLTNLPPISSPVTIDPFTFSGTPFELSGENISSGSSVGLHFTSDGGSQIGGLTINRFDTLVKIEGSGGNRFKANNLGTDVTGNTRLGSSGFTAVHILSDDNVIGTGSLSEGNLIAGGIRGIDIQSGSGNIIQGNRIGTNAAGTAAIVPGGIEAGIRIRHTAGANIIGNPNFGQGTENIISGHINGVVLESQPASTVLNNFIGTDIGSISAIPNNVGINVFSSNNLIESNTVSGNTNEGIILQNGGDANTIRFNRIGAGFASPPLPNTVGISIRSSNNLIENNEIAFNSAKGIEFPQGNTIPTGNSIFANIPIIPGSSESSIYSNGGLGISLTNGNAPLLNDPGDADTGVNNGQNYPVLTIATSIAGNTNIQGTLNSTASSNFTLHFYANLSCDPSGFGEGGTFIGSANVATTAGGITGFNLNLPVAVPTGSFITATATDGQGNTSEFSQCKIVSLPPVSIRGRLTDNSNAPLVNTQIQINGGLFRKILTNRNGEYSFVNLPGGNNYTVTPILKDFTFSPLSRSYANLTTDQTDQNFTGTKTAFTVSGRIRSQEGNSLLPLPGVTVSLLSGVNLVRSTVTDANGFYSFSNIAAGSYSVTPSKQNYAFSPSSAGVTVSPNDAAADFTAQNLLSQLTGRIFFTGNTGIKAMNANGSGLVTVLPYTLDSFLSVAVSPDGRKIVSSVPRVADGGISGRSVVYIISTANLDGSNLVQFPTPWAEKLNLSWSFDGTKLAFIAPGGAIFTMNPDGTNPIPVIFQGGGQISHVSWSPDGTKFVFSSSSGIFTVNSDGSNLTQLVTATNASAPSFSPNGTKIAFMNGGNLFVMNPDGSSQTQIASNISLNQKPAWSPDSSRIVFNRGGAVNRIQSVEANGGGLVTIADNEFGTNFSWGVPPEIATGTGANVTVQAGGTSLTFSGVGTAGTTTVTPIPPASAGTLPGGFVFGNVAYEITTTAVFTPPITVCFNVPQSAAPTETAFNALSLMHNEGGVLVDRTTSRNFATRTICGQVSTLSPFVLAEQIDPNLPSITGLVVDTNGDPLSGVIVKLTGTETRFAQTDSFGIFSFNNLTQSGNYNTQPKQTGYLFTEYSQDFVNLTGENAVVFTGEQNNFSIGGRVADGNGNGVSGIIVQLDGAFSEFAVTDGSGDYVFSNLPADGFYVITPTGGSGSFVPSQIMVDALTSNFGGNNFIQLAPTAAGVSVGGRISAANGGGIPGAQISITNLNGETRAVVSNSFGYYRFENVRAGETYVLNVQSREHQFPDAPRLIFVNEDLTGMNFTASP